MSASHVATWRYGEAFTRGSSYMKSAIATLLSLLLAASPASAICAEVSTPPKKAQPAGRVRIEKRVIHSAAIAENLLGTSPDRDVYVALPPSYDQQPGRRYPVVYALHGFSINAAKWLDELHAQAAIEAAFATGTPEMIIVFPDGSNEYGGSFYGQSQVTGNFEDFIAEELPAFIDRTYRSIPRPASRGLMGHSMGGYGAARIGMRRPGRFGALYLMSPCCLAPLGVQGLATETVAEIATFKAPSDAVGLPFKYAGPLATSAAFSPNPAKPPLFVDLPVSETGELRPDILAKRAANAPLAIIDQHVAALRSYRAIGIDVGDQDSIVPAATQLHKNLDNYAIPNQLEVYPGNHTNKVSSRFETVVLPFFGNTLTR
ncbi:alpha/beta hydrolase [Sphingomonas sp. ZT3P38]|uniref:alpha/beta hydrolase n=1 Tax=Parasphingomonas zepuensis TaxID=3096161 RepID=UPI002FCB48EB